MSSNTQSQPPTAPPALHPGARDFDFFHGTWKVKCRRLRVRLAGCTEWEEFEARSRCRPFLDGRGNEDDFTTPSRPGYRGMSLRFFDSNEQKWWIYWVDTNNSGALLPPVSGAFTDGTGVFLGDDEFEGRPIICRYTWSRTDTEAPRWEQAFSEDGGINWETNWVNDFTRVSAEWLPE